MSNNDIRFAIAGAGNVARYHATGVLRTPGARLVAVSRSSPAGAAEAAARFGVPCETSFEALLARDDMDAICICTPSGQHAQQAIAAARAGKHVLVEKPMALTLADADAMLAAAREAGTLLGIALQRRVDPVFQAVATSIAAGELGRPLLGSVSIPYLRPQSYYDSAAWRGTWALDGGGALMNQGIHLVDLLVWYLGDVVEAHARYDTLAHTIEVEDTLSATLRFASGALGSVLATTGAAPGFPHRVEVYGSSGGVQFEGETIARWEGQAARPDLVTTQAGPVDAGPGANPMGIGAVGHTRLLNDFVDAIRTGRPPAVPGPEGRRSLAAVLAIYDAARASASSV